MTRTTTNIIYGILLTLQLVLIVLNYAFGNYDDMLYCVVIAIFIASSFFCSRWMHDSREAEQTMLIIIAKLTRKLEEAEKREKIHHQEFAKMRQRAEAAEKVNYNITSEK